MLQSGFPISMRVCYGSKDEDTTNEMECNNLEEMTYALQVFVKEYMEGGEK